MSSSILGYAILGGDQSVNYNGFKFKRTQTGWETKIQGNNVQFHYHPTELENINLNSTITETIKDKKMLYLTFDPDAEEISFIDLARFDIVNTLFNNLDIYAESATTKNSTYGFSIINCSDATSSVPVLMLTKSNLTEFDKQDNCILLKAKTGPEILALKDRLLYSLLGVIQ